MYEVGVGGRGGTVRFCSRTHTFGHCMVCIAFSSVVHIEVKLQIFQIRFSLQTNKPLEIKLLVLCDCGEEGVNSYLSPPER